MKVETIHHSLLPTKNDILPVCSEKFIKTCKKKSFFSCFVQWIIQLLFLHYEPYRGATERYCMVKDIIFHIFPTLADTRSAFIFVDLNFFLFSFIDFGCGEDTNVIRGPSSKWTNGTFQSVQSDKNKPKRTFRSASGQDSPRKKLISRFSHWLPTSGSSFKIYISGWVLPWH